MTRKRLKLAVITVFWVSAHLAYFAWYHRLLGLEFSMASAVIVGLLSCWLFSIILFFRSRWVRFGLAALYSSGLLWSLVNFAYFRVFHTFLAASSSRLMSLNWAVLRVVLDYASLVPVPLIVTIVALLALLIAVDRLLHAFWKADSVVSIELLPEHHLHYDLAAAPQRHRRRIFAVGVIVQLVFLAAVTLVSGGIRRDLNSADLSPEELLSRLGLIGYALASERVDAEAASADERAQLRAQAPAMTLSLAQSNIEALRSDLADLASGAKRGGGSAKPMGPAPKHVIFYQLESGGQWPLQQSPSPMPFVASLMERYGTVQDYFANGCTTVDSEFAVNCGFLPETYGPVSDLYAKNAYRCLPQLLKERGFATSIYHANDSTFWSRDSLAPAWGFDRLGFTPAFTYRAPDAVLFDQAIADIKATDKPTFQYVIGMTSHAPHNEHFRNFYNREFGLGLEPYRGELNGASRLIDLDEPTLRLYLGFLKAADDGVRHLFERLEQEKLLDSTVVVIYGDHRYYDARQDDPIKGFLAYNKLPFVFYAPGLDKPQWPAVASHLDIAPTVWDLVTGSDSGLPPTFLGRSLFSTEHVAAAVTKCLGRVSYYDGQSLVTGDIPLNKFQTRAVTGASDASRDDDLRDRLFRAAMISDLMFSRNELGQNAQVSPASAQVQFDNITDSDKDGLSDLREVGIGTDPHKPDTDGDGYLDGIEVSNGFNPLGTGRWVRKSTE